MNVTETTVDGIYTLFVERDDPTVHAGLVFRVGQADESLAVRGLTHLVQHLALHDVTGDVHAHGTTGVVHTEFRASGDAAEVSRVLNGVCAALREPPVEHLATVRTVLDTEDVATDRSSRRSSAVRHGAQAHGLESYPEIGLPGLGEVDVTTWTSVAFTRGNAVLWVVGPRIPRDLDLELPDGPTVPAPPATSVLPRTPAWYLDPGAGEVELCAIIPRSPAADVLARVLERALRHDVTVRARLADAVEASCDAQDPEHQVLRLVLRGRPEQAPALVGALVDALARLRWGAIPDEEVEAAKDELIDELSDPGAVLVALPRMAVDALLGDAPAPQWSAEHAVDVVTVPELRAVAEELQRTALVRAPDPGLDWAGFATVPTSSPRAVDGEEVLAVDGSDEVLVVSEDGVTRHSGFRVATVYFEEVAVLQRFADGGRWFIGRDGTEVRVEPRLFGLDEGVLAELDASVDRARVVLLPARGPDRLPGHSTSLLVEPKEDVMVDAGGGSALPAEPPAAATRRSLSSFFNRRQRD